MNSADRYTLKEFARRGVVMEADIERLKELTKRGLCERVEYIDEASKPHPDVICQVFLTTKGMEAIGG